MTVFALGEGATVATDVTAAETFGARFFGLMGRKRLGREEGLWLPRCRAVHTWFMRTAIDIVFVNADMRVVRVASQVVPWRLAGAVGATHVLELAPGRALAAGVRAGDRLVIRG